MRAEESPRPDGPAVRVRVRRWHGGRAQELGLDRVALEEPLEIRVETRALAVVMRTPGHDEELAAGFLLSEGVIASLADVRAIRPHPRSRRGNVLDVFLSGAKAPDLGGFARKVFASASCGLCGRTSIAAVCRRLPAVRERYEVSPGLLQAAFEQLRAGQPGFLATGGLHAAGLIGVGELESALIVREDVGRHNAVDKAIGRRFLDDRLPVRRGVLVVTSRVSFEIVQKALAAGIGCVAAVGAPSSLAVALARAGGQTLVGFFRDGRFNVYAGEHRLRGGAPVPMRKASAKNGVAGTSERPAK